MKLTTAMAHNSSSTTTIRWHSFTSQAEPNNSQPKTSNSAVTTAPPKKKTRKQGKQARCGIVKRTKISKKRFQPRVGYKDWKMLVRLQQICMKLADEITPFTEFVNRKSIANNIPDRVDIGQCKQPELLRIFQALDACTVPTTRGELIVDITAAANYGVTVWEKYRRQLVVVPGNDAKHVIPVYQLFYYFRPQLCWYRDKNGNFCKQRHRTVHEYSRAHPEVHNTQLSLSHIGHQSMSCDVAQIVMEPLSINSKRNVCRQKCQCGAYPRCFTNNATAFDETTDVHVDNIAIPFGDVSAQDYEDLHDFDGNTGEAINTNGNNGDDDNNDDDD